jgi:hypothetical protein
MDGIVRTPEEWEAIAIRFRADCAIVPYRVWIQLSAASKGKLGPLTQNGARKLLAGQAAPPTRLTMEVFKENMLAVVELTQGVVGPGADIPAGYADAIRALPDRTLLGALPKELRAFIERELADIEVGK